MKLIKELDKLAMEEEQELLDSVNKDFDPTVTFQQSSDDLQQCMDAISSLEEMQDLLLSDIDQGGISPQQARMVKLAFEAYVTPILGSQSELSIETFHNEYNNYGATLKLSQDIDLAMEGIGAKIKDKITSLFGLLGKECTKYTRRLLDIKADIKKLKANYSKLTPDTKSTAVQLAHSNLFKVKGQINPKKAVESYMSFAISEFVLNNPIDPTLKALSTIESSIEQYAKTDKVQITDSMIEELGLSAKKIFDATIQSYWKPSKPSKDGLPAYEFSPSDGVIISKGGVDPSVTLIPNGYQVQLNKGETKAGVDAPTMEDVLLLERAVDAGLKVYDGLNKRLTMVIRWSKAIEQGYDDYVSEQRTGRIRAKAIGYAALAVMVLGYMGAFAGAAQMGHASTLGKGIANYIMGLAGAVTGTIMYTSPRRMLDAETKNTEARSSIAAKYKNTSNKVEGRMSDLAKSVLNATEDYVQFVESYAHYVNKGA